MRSILLTPFQFESFNRLAKAQFVGRKLAFAMSLTLGLSFAEATLLSAPAHACFYWQECAQQRGQASNTRAGGKRTGLIQGGNDDTIPYVISPRNSWIGEGQRPAHIHWNSVAGTKHYTVRIWQWTYERTFPSEVVWETTVESSNTQQAVLEVDFPDVPLSLGRYYSVEVVTEGGVSSDLDEGYYQSGFQLLSEIDYENVEAHIAQVQRQTAAQTDSTTEETQLAIAGAYFLDEMYANALLILEMLAENPAASHLVYTALGDTYSATGLNQLSIEAYEQALALAEASNKTRGRATVLVSMADIYVRTGQFEQAGELLLLARQAYSEIGAYPEVSMLDQKIGLLSSFQTRTP